MSRSAAIAIFLALLLAIPCAAQTYTTEQYRGLTVLADPDPSGAAGIAWQANFVALADRLGNHIEAAVDPTAEDDSAGTGGHDAVMDLSTWRNTTDNGLWLCVDASVEYAVWVELTGIDWTGATADFLTTGSGHFGGDGVLIQGDDGYLNLYVDGAGRGHIDTSSGDPMRLASDAYLDLQYAQTAGAAFFRYTTGNPTCCFYGYDSSEGAVKYGQIWVNPSGQFQIAGATGETLRLTANGTSSVYGVYIGVDGTFYLPNDDQALACGAAGTADSYREYTGSYLHEFAAGGTKFDNSIGIGVAPSATAMIYGYAVSGSTYGVKGFSAASAGVMGQSTSSYGVYGISANSIGVIGIATASHGVYGQSTNNYGVYGTSVNGYGVYGTSTNAYAGRFYRNTATPTNAVPIVYMQQAHASDSNGCLYAEQGGSGYVARLKGVGGEVYVYSDGDVALLGDNQAINLGAGEDFSIYWDGAATQFDGLGNYVFNGTLGDFTIASDGNTFFFTRDGANYIYGTAANSSLYLGAGNHSQVFSIRASERVGINETSPDYTLDANGSLGFSPGSSVTPVDNGDVVFELTSDTTLTVKAKGSDGTVRSATLTLSP